MQVLRHSNLDCSKTRNAIENQQCLKALNSIELDMGSITLDETHELELCLLFHF